MYLVENPHSSIYELELVSMNDILAKIWDNSVLFMDKSVKWFTKWCGGRDLTFFSVPSKRPKNEYADRISMRSLYVLKDKYISKLYLLCFHKSAFTNLVT